MKTKKSSKKEEKRIILDSIMEILPLYIGLCSGLVIALCLFGVLGIMEMVFHFEIPISNFLLNITPGVIGISAFFGEKICKGFKKIFKSLKTERR